MRLISPSGALAQPVPAKVRAAIFNILGNELRGVRVLDTYSGSGSFGIEALSRGAESCLFVEKARSLCATIEKNIAKVKAQDRAEIMNADVFELPAILAQRQSEPFELAFFDPPYILTDSPSGRKKLADVIQQLAGSPAMLASVYYLVRVRAGVEFIALVESALPDTCRTYGSTRIEIFTIPTDLVVSPQRHGEHGEETEKR